VHTKSTRDTRTYTSNSQIDDCSNSSSQKDDCSDSNSQIDDCFYYDIGRPVAHDVCWDPVP
jgi:hypothetical protein